MQRYLTLLLGPLLALLLTTVLLNRLVDPYALFTGPTIDGVNSLKPETGTRQRLAKVYQVRRLRPDAVLLGTSRALALPESIPGRERVFNLALTSSSLYEQYRYLQHAQAQGALRTAVIGLDYFAFVDSRGGQFRETRLDTDAEGNPQTHPLGIDTADLLPALLTLDALRSSLTTLREQTPEADAATLRAERIARKGGHHALFTELERGALKQRPVADPGRVIGSLERPGTFRRLLRLAHRTGLDLHLFISPSHARLWEVWRLRGLEQTLFDWKRRLVRANHEEAALAGRSPFPLWDFSGYNSITREPLPAPGDTVTLMHGYWEGSHYSAAVAAQIMQRLFPGADTALPDDFGLRLDATTIESSLAAQRLAGDAWRSAHAQEVAALRRVYAQVNGERTNP